MKTLVVATAAIAVALASASDSWAKRPPKTMHPIDLEVVGSDAPDIVALEPMEAWPLTFRLRLNEDEFLGFGRPRISGPVMPQRDDPVTAVFETAGEDGCPSVLGIQEQENHNETVCGPDLECGTADDPDPPDPSTLGNLADCVPPPEVPWPVDELSLPLSSGITVPELVLNGDPGGEPRPVICVADDDPDATVQAPCPLNNPSLAEYGPRLGTPDDGFSYGASERLQGLVVVADSGPSLVVDELFDLPYPRQCRNLAGLLTTVGVELFSAQGSTNVTAHYNMPFEMLTPLVQLDAKLGPLDDNGDPTGDPSCPSGVLFRVDGGPIQCQTNGNGPFQAYNQTVTLRAFVVSIDNAVTDADGNPQLPDLITDLDGDELCTINDAALAGYRLLSGEQIVRISQYHEDYFGSFVDLDGNGTAGGPVLPAGGGGIFFPPR